MWARGSACHCLPLRKGLCDVAGTGESRQQVVVAQFIQTLKVSNVKQAEKASNIKIKKFHSSDCEPNCHHFLPTSFLGTG